MRICLVTDPGICREADLPGYVVAAAAAGLDMIQVRAPELGGGRLLALVRGIIHGLTEAHIEVPVLVNRRLDVALAASAAGVHLPAAGLNPMDVRRLTPPGFLLGVSVHDAGEVGRALAGGADYMFLGPAFPTASHAGAPALGVAGVAALLPAAGCCPVWAIGGVSAATAPGLAALPLAGVAAIRSLLTAADPAAAVRELRAALTSRSSPE